jgi:hypothetical protein
MYYVLYPLTPGVFRSLEEDGETLLLVTKTTLSAIAIITDREKGQGKNGRGKKISGQ